MVRIIGSRSVAVLPFADEVHDMGDFIMANPRILGEDITIVNRELQHGPDGRRVDFLVCDSETGQVGIVELKKDYADEKVLLQTLRYADWLRNNPDTIRYQVSRQKALTIDPEELELDSLKIYIVAPKIAPAVAELSQYISGIDFEFIQIERFRDSSGEVYAVTSPLEVPNRTVAPTRSRLEYDPTSYAAAGFSDERKVVIESAIQELSDICNSEAWPLSPRYLKNAVKFQTGSGRNVFFIVVRKRTDHPMRFCLGPEFNPLSSNLYSNLCTALKQRKPKSPWWSLPLTTAPIETYHPLLQLAYSYVTQ